MTEPSAQSPTGPSDVGGASAAQGDDAGPAGSGVPHLFDIPAWLQRAAGWSWRLLIVGAAVLALGWVLVRIRIVVVPTLVAVLIAALLGPLARRLRDRGVPSLVATWVVLIGAAVIVGGLLALAGVLIAGTLASDADRWREIGDDLRTWLTSDAPVTLDDDQIDDLWQRARDAAVSGLRDGGGDAVRLVVEIGSGLLLGVVLVFFFVHDGDRMWRWIVDRLARTRADAIDEAGRRSLATLSAYLRGLAITGVVDAVIIGLGLLVLGVPLAFPLAVLTFFGAFIPIVGATAAGVLAALVALVSEGPTTAALTVVLVLVVQQVEGDVVMPLVMRRQVRLHPAAILVAVASGAAIAGVIGAFLAVPVAAVLVEATSSLRTAARRSAITDPSPSSA